MDDRTTADSGREAALARLRRELDDHARSGSPDSPFFAGIREIVGREDLLDERGSSSGSAA
jgi:hypothetical protein